MAPKKNGKVRLYLGPFRFNEALTKPIQRVPTVDDIFLNITNAKYLTLINMNSGYHKLKIDDNSSDQNTFFYQLGTQI